MTKCRRPFWFFPLIVCVVGAMPAIAVAEEDSVLSFLGQGEAKLSFRYRYEGVDQDGLPEDAHASTLRTRLAYQTPTDQLIQLTLEADNVLRLGGANFSDGNRTVAGHPVVADPNGTEINQALLTIKPGDSAQFRLGRQRINYDDQRFVGGVGWRQNEQTYDAVRADFKVHEALTVDYSYLWNINRIFGPEGGAQAADWDCQCHLLNIGVRPWQNAKLALFGYSLDLEDAPALASRTVGLRLDGTHKTSDALQLNYLLSYASQSDAGDNPTNYSAPYWHVRFGAARKGLKASLGLEVLGGDANVPGARFVTPLATLHAFNGWADKFLATPATGLQDLYLRLDAPIGGFKATIFYHDFSAEAGSQDYGSEWDLAVSRKITEHLSLLGKFAHYDADGLATDTRKLWFMASYTP